MTRIVHEGICVVDLPLALRDGLAVDAKVRVIIEAGNQWDDRTSTLDKLLALRQPPYQSMDEIVAEIRKDRDAWDE